MLRDCWFSLRTTIHLLIILVRVLTTITFPRPKVWKRERVILEKKL